MKKRIAVLLGAALLLTVVLAACGGGAKGDEIGLLKSGTLQVGMEIGYPPFELYDGDTPIGLDVDLAKAIAGELGVEVEFVDTAWDGIFAGLDIDKYDCVISAVTIDGERKKAMDFTTPYIENWQAIVVKKGSPAVESMQGLNGLKVGYQGETTSDKYLAAMVDTGALSCEVSEYDKVLGCFDDLKLGRLDAVLCDSTVADGYVARDPDSFIITWIQSTEEGAEAETFGVAVKKGNSKLLDELNKILKKFEDDGKLDEIRNNWL